MGIDDSAILQSINPPQLTAIARQSVQSDGMAEDDMERIVAPDCFEVTMAHEAYALLGSIW